MAIEDLISNKYEELVETATADAGPLRVYGATEEEKSEYQRELSAKRGYYFNERRMVSEELACDFFAFTFLAKSIAAGERRADDLRLRFEMFVGLFTIVFNFHLLHMAFTARAKLFSEGHTPATPDSMSLYNLRRVAITVLGSSFLAHVLADLGALTSGETAESVSQYFQELQSRIYVEMSNSILMPAIPMLKSCFRSVDSLFPRELRAAATPTTAPAERLFLSSLAFKLDRDVLSDMLSRGHDGLIEQLYPYIAQALAHASRRAPRQELGIACHVRDQIEHLARRVAHDAPL